MKFLRWAAHAASIVTLIACLPSCALAQSQQDAAQNQAERQPAANGQQPTQPPIAITVTTPEQSPDERRQERQDRERELAIQEGIRRITVGLLIVAVLQFVAVIGQIVIARKQNRLFNAQNRVIKSQLDTTVAIERAWVNLERLEIELSTRLNGPMTVAASFKNSGRSTAKIISANITLRSCWQDNGTIRDLPDLPEEPEYDSTPVAVPPAILVAGETSTMRVSLNDFDMMNRWRLAHTSHGSSDAAWIYGFVTYTDGLNPDIIRRYGWARKYDRALSESAQGGFRFRFAHVNKPKYNYAE